MVIPPSVTGRLFLFPNEKLQGTYYFFHNTNKLYPFTSNLLLNYGAYTMRSRGFGLPFSVCTSTCNLTSLPSS